MKKAIVIISIFIIFFIIYFLQSNFFTWFNISGIMPNLFVMLLLFITLFAGEKVGIIYAIILGLFLDIIIGKQLGSSSIMFLLVSILGIYFNKNFSKDSRITIMLMVIASTCLFEIGMYILNIMRLSINIEILPFVKTLLIEVIYNTIIVVILYPLIQKLGHYAENTFKNQKILTKYF